AVELLRSSKTTLQHKRFQSFIYPRDLETFYSFLHRMQESRSKVNTEVRLILPNKETLFTRIEGIVIPDMTSSHIKYYITVIDTTESRNAQQLLKETNERLE